MSREEHYWEGGVEDGRNSIDMIGRCKSDIGKGGLCRVGKQGIR